MAYCTCTFPQLLLENNFSLEVVNVNDSPIIVTGDIVNVNEDSTYYNYYDATDDEDDALVWTMITDATWLDMNISGELTGTPSNADVGIYNVTVIVSDGNGGSDESTFQLIVNNTNDSPQITTTPISMWSTLNYHRPLTPFWSTTGIMVIAVVPTH